MSLAPFGAAGRPGAAAVPGHGSIRSGARSPSGPFARAFAAHAAIRRDWAAGRLPDGAFMGAWIAARAAVLAAEPADLDEAALVALCIAETAADLAIAADAGGGARGELAETAGEIEAAAARLWCFLDRAGGRKARPVARAMGFDPDAG